MIPKIIHYCWLSGEEFPQDIKRNIASWNALLPDYEFMLWDTKRFDLEQWPFAKEAFENKKYAFASDIVRLYAVHQYGGIYLDTDVQILKKFDNLLHLPYFVGLEYENIIEAAIFGAEKNSEWLAHCLKHYENRSFVKEDGSFDITIAPYILKLQLQKVKRVVSMTSDQVKTVEKLIQDKKKFFLFPYEYFSPKDVQSGKIHNTKNTYTVHHFNSSWLPYFSKLRRKIKLALGVKTINKILKIGMFSKILLVLKKIEAKLDSK
jgi:hypothetical protein